ncbi:MAG TPA: alpha-glucosidase [Balneolaceae bacterium]|nr:alpha-glucosidase [Balneolaceae bacterium]
MRKGLFVSIFLSLAIVFGCSKQNPQTDSSDHNINKKWWKEAVVYQIYPRSFKDSDSDGIGDLQGIISKLDYIKSLGVDVVWLNPIYASPNYDNGYDISNYRKIMDEFGTMDDFDQMLKGMHKRGIKLMMDLVVNHTSDQHRWFKQSRSSRDNPYRDYYHWWPAERGKPNPRYSFFDVNNNAWKYDSLTDAWYLHYFSVHQPDLNWENPEVRQQVYKIMKFWLNKGIDGFRMDAFQFVAKDTTFPKLPKGYEKNIIKYYGMGPHLHDYIKEMYRQVLSHYDVMTVAEGAGSTFQDAISLVAPKRHELNMVYHFDGMDIGNSLDGYKLTDFKRVYTRWDSAMAGKGWLSIFLANHDVPRMVSKFGNDSPEYRRHSSQMLTTFILSMHGTPYYYNGDELGMTNIDFDDISDYRDIAAKNGYEKVKENNGDLQHYMKRLNFLSRDNARTPFQWDTTANAGFTTGTPWIQVNPNYRKINVAVEEQDPNSCLNYFRRMMALRKQHSVLVYGDYQLLLPKDEQVYAYTRTLDSQKMLVLLNFSTEEATVELPDSISTHKIMINNYSSVDRQNASITLNPYQAVIYSLN